MIRTKKQQNLSKFNTIEIGNSGGSLKPQTEALETQLNGSIMGSVVVGDHLKLLYPRSTWSYTGQKGTLEGLAVKCYMNMFDGCSSLNYVKCLAKDISATQCTYQWLSGVSGSGTFVTPAATGWSTGVSGIPSGWSRVAE